MAKTETNDLHVKDVVSIPQLRIPQIKRGFNSHPCVAQNKYRRRFCKKTYGSIQVFVDSAVPLKSVEFDAQAHAHSAQGVIRGL